MSKKVTRLWIPVFVLLLIAGCCSAATAAENSREFVFVGVAEASHLDPHFITSGSSGCIMRQIHDTLLKRVEASEIVPNLALDAVEVDPLTWKITLREGVSFHCGEPFNSAAVKYTWERLLDPATRSPRRSVMSYIKSIECPSDTEVIVHLTQRNMMFKGLITSYTTAIMCPACGAEHGIQGYTTHPCGTGALKLDHWTRGIELVMVRNDNWWGGKAKADKITFKGLAEDATRVMMVMTGDADVVAAIPPTLVSNLKNAPDVTVVIAPGYRTMNVGFNHTKKPFDDVRVRQALNYAIDKRTIIDNLLMGMGEYPAGFIATSVEYAHPDIEPYEYNPAKAKELLAEAGYPDGFSCEVAMTEGRYPAEVVQAMLAEVGVKVTIQVREQGAHQELLNTLGTELYFIGRGNAAGDAEYSFVNYFIPTGSMNYSGTNDPAITELFNSMADCKDMEERKQILYKMQEILMENAHAVPLYYEYQFFASRSSVKGFRLYPNEQYEIWDLERE